MYLYQGKKAIFLYYHRAHFEITVQLEYFLKKYINNTETLQLAREGNKVCSLPVGR